MIKLAVLRHTGFTLVFILIFFFNLKGWRHLQDQTASPVVSATLLVVVRSLSFSEE